MCSMLNSHAEVLCHHEIFNPEGIHYALDHRGGDLNLGTAEERDREPLRFIERLWQETFGKRVVGFKLNRGQNALAFASVLADRGVRKILLLRRNRIKTFVSEMIAERTGRWESYQQRDNEKAGARLEVDVASLLGHIELNYAYYARLRDALNRSGQSYLTVAYEDLASEKEWARILKYLGVSPCAAMLTAATRKQNSNDLRDLIANFAQLETALRDPELASELRSLNP